MIHEATHIPPIYVATPAASGSYFTNRITAISKKRLNAKPVTQNMKNPISISTPFYTRN